jgi:hypothetical protein
MPADPTDESSVQVGQCQSCGDEATDLTLVRRLWVTPEDWDTPGSVTEGDVEWWCFVCRTHYPHQEEPIST